MNRNERKYILECLFYNTAVMLMSGSVIQAFLLENGANETAISLYLSVFQMVQVVTMLILSMFVDKIKNIVKASALLALSQLGFFAALIAICVFNNVTITFKYALVFSVGILTSIIQACKNIFSYKMPYFVIRMSRYGRITGMTGVVLGVTGSLISAAMAYFTGNYNYNIVMLCFFIFGGLLLVLDFGMVMSYDLSQPNETITETNNGKGKLKELLSYKPFTALLIPNLLRGFCSGILSVCMTIGFSMGITNSSSGAVLSMLMQLAVILSCVVYSFIAKANSNDGKIILIASIALVLFMPAMLSGKDIKFFYILYFLCYFAVTFVDYSVPVAVTKLVDYDYIGIYTSWRMLIHTLGIAISNALLTPMLSVFGGKFTMLIAAICQLMSGVLYYRFLAKNRKTI